MLRGGYAVIPFDGLTIGPPIRAHAIDISGLEDLVFLGKPLFSVGLRARLSQSGPVYNVPSLPFSPPLWDTENERWIIQSQWGKWFIRIWWTDTEQAIMISDI